MHRLASVTAVAIALAILPAACTAPPQGVVEMANRSYTGSAMGKPYATVVTGSFGATQSPFGAMIGSYALADGQTVYRHVAVGATSETSVDLGIVGGSRNTADLLRLSYFRVGANGVVTDWAVGSVPGDQTACRHYAAGIHQACTDVAAERQALGLYDSIVRTSGGQPLSAWGPPRAEPVAAGSTVPATPQLRIPYNGYPGANPDADAAYTN